MIFLLSPAKSLNFEAKITTKNFTQPIFLNESKILIKDLKQLSAQEIAKLMKISDKLANLNYARFQNFKTPFSVDNAKPAIFVFDGDVYDAINPENYSENQLDFAQKQMRILSGLYGIIKPKDLIQPYRLEMSINFKNKLGKNLYEFWGNKITQILNKEEQNTIINLASEEYFKAVHKATLKAKVINILFKEKKDGEYRIIGIHAKKARGLMSDFIIQNKIDKPQDLKIFNEQKYKFMPKFSDDENFVFCR